LLWLGFPRNQCFASGALRSLVGQNSSRKRKKQKEKKIATRLEVNPKEDGRKAINTET
jgi:hypothetical protein